MPCLSCVKSGSNANLRLARCADSTVDDLLDTGIFESYGIACFFRP